MNKNSCERVKRLEIFDMMSFVTVRDESSRRSDLKSRRIRFSRYDLLHTMRCVANKSIIIIFQRVDASYLHRDYRDHRTDYTVRRWTNAAGQKGGETQRMQRAWNAPGRRASTQRSWSRRPVRGEGRGARRRKERASRTERARNGV